MVDKTNETESRVSLEDLLKLKRAERPDEAFWDRFDAQLHQRMLQTLVKKDPWHAQVLRCFRLRVVQGLSFACATVVAFVALERSGTFSDEAPEHLAMATTEQSASAEAAVGAGSGMAIFEEALPAVFASHTASSAEPAINSRAADRTEFGIGHVHRAKPMPEASFTREFGSDSVRMASSSTEQYRMDFGASTVSVSGARTSRLVY